MPFGVHLKYLTTDWNPPILHCSDVVAVTLDSWDSHIKQLMTQQRLSVRRAEPFFKSTFSFLILSKYTLLSFIWNNHCVHHQSDKTNFDRDECTRYVGIVCWQHSPVMLAQLFMLKWQGAKASSACSLLSTLELTLISVYVMCNNCRKMYYWRKM